MSSLCVLIFRLRGYHALWRDFPNPSTIFIHTLVKILLPLVCLNKQGLGCSPFARHYLGNHCCFLFLWVLRCFSSPRSLFLLKVPELLSGGLPHSEICGSRRMCQSPQLITSFFAPESLGIHRLPSLYFFAQIYILLHISSPLLHVEYTVIEFLSEVTLRLPFNALLSFLFYLTCHSVASPRLREAATIGWRSTLCCFFVSSIMSKIASHIVTSSEITG